MFLTYADRPIDSELNDLVEKIEADNPALSVFGARQFRDRLYQTPVRVNIVKARDLNVLEEFILRASIEFVPPPTEEELAQILKLDPVFIKNTTTTLEKLKILEKLSDYSIKITADGHNFYEKGLVPEPPETKVIYAISDRLSGEITWRSSPLVNKAIAFPDLAELVAFKNSTIDAASLTLEEVQKRLENSKLGLHIPAEGQMVSGFSVTEDAEVIWQNVSVFAIFDSLEEKLIIQVRQGDKILAPASEFLQEMESNGGVSLTELCQLSPEAIALKKELVIEVKNQEVEARMEKIRQQEIEEIEKIRESGKKSSSVNLGVVCLRDRQIRPEFLSTLKAASRQILIYSPWATEEVIDKEFIRLLQKLADSGVWILIGYGIAQKQEEETKPMPPQVEEKLLTVKTPEGLPAAQIFWLGNSHAKEVVVDRKVHLSGSQNWLSYRGDRLPRGETSYKVIIPNNVEEAYEYLAGRFQSHAEKLWDEGVSKWDVELGLKCLCIWNGLGMEAKALQELENNNWWELLPVWLKGVCQGLRSKQVSADAVVFEKAISGLTKVSETEENIELLREGWQKVMGAIALQSREAALSWLNEEVWREFMRLEIANLSADTPEKFISGLVGEEAEAKGTKKKKTVKRKRKTQK